jgi:hypothetical protein
MKDHIDQIIANKLSPIKAWIYRKFGLFGKDTLMSIKGLVLSGFFFLGLLLASIIANFPKRFETDWLDPKLPFLSFLLLCYAIGFTLTGIEEDRESNNSIFIHRLPIHPFNYLGSKLLVGAVLVLLWEVIFMELPRLLFQETFPALKDLSFAADLPLYDDVYFRGLCLFTTGIAFSLFSRGHLFSFGLLGFIVVFLYFYITNGIDDALAVYAFNNQSLLTLSSIISQKLLLVLWCFLMPTLSLIYLTKRDESFDGYKLPTIGLWNSSNKEDRIRFCAPLLSFFHLRILYFTIPILSGGAAWFFSWINLWKLNDIPLLLLTALFCSFNSCYAWMSEERDRRDSFLYALPINESVFLLQRVFAVTILNVMTVLFILIGLNITSLQSGTNLLLNWPQIIQTMALAISIGLFGFIYRVILKLLLASVFVTIGQSLIFALCIEAQYYLNQDKMINLADIIWPSSVLIGSSFFLLIFLFRYSLLLEMNQKLKNASVNILLLVFSFWIIFTISLSPIDLFRMIFS